MGQEIDFSIEDKRNNQLFDDLSSMFERLEFKGDPQASFGLEMLLTAERRLQDLSDLLSKREGNEAAGIRFASSASHGFLQYWKTITNRGIDQKLFHRFIKFLKILSVQLTEIVAHPLTLEQVHARMSDAYLSIEDLMLNHNINDTWHDFINKHNPVRDDDVEEIAVDPDFYAYVSTNENNDKNSKSILYESYKENFNEGNNKGDEENFLYSWDMELYINTHDAGNANHFMYLISSTLKYIDGVEILIVDAGIGSLWQRWKINIKSFFAKKRTQEILQKSLKAAEAYAMDRHIEPVEKIKAEKEKTQAETKGLMSEQQAQKLHDLTLQEKEQDILAKKLANAEKLIQINLVIEDRLGRGLAETRDDFRIMLNGLLLAERKNKELKFGDNDALETGANQS